MKELPRGLFRTRPYYMNAIHISRKHPSMNAVALAIESPLFHISCFLSLLHVKSFSQKNTRLLFLDPRARTLLCLLYCLTSAEARGGIAMLELRGSGYRYSPTSPSSLRLASSLLVSLPLSLHLQAPLEHPKRGGKSRS